MSEPLVKTKLLYFGDPMCSWCWGISDHLEKIKAHFSKHLDLELVMGGLRSGGGQKWDADMKNFLKGHWQHVERASGQEFNYDLLERDNFNYDTEPPCRAVVSARQIALDKAFDFYQCIQFGFYVENGDPGDVKFYEPICNTLEVDFKEFCDIFNSENTKTLTFEDFHRTHSYGISGFPTIVLQVEGRFHAIASGYSTFDKMKERIDTLL